MDEVDLREILEAAIADEPPQHERVRATRARPLVREEEPEADE